MAPTGRRRRALILEPAGNLWGSERALLGFLAQAVRTDWDIAVCCPPRTPLIEKLDALPVDVIPALLPNMHRGGKVRRAAGYARFVGSALRFAPDIIHVNQAGATRMAVVAGRLLRAPVVPHLRIVEDVRYLERLAPSPGLVPRVICVSEFMRRTLQAASHTWAARAVTIYDPYAPTAHGRTFPGSALRGAPPTIGCVGRLARGKGQDVLLRALAVLARDNVDVRAEFLGDAGPGDAFGSELRALATELGIANRVTWRGFHHEPLERMPAFAAVACPSQVEPLGRVILEALDAGVVPIAWAGSGGAAEVMSASGGGILYERQDPQGLAGAIVRALHLQEVDSQGMVAAGRRWIENHCNPVDHCAGVLQQWEAALAARNAKVA